MDLILALAGLALLLAAGDILVRGAVALSLKLGVSALVIGLTVVAFGTSAPELLVSVQAALRGAPGIAVGNVVGSNIANILLVLGVPALIAAIDASKHDTRRSYVQMLAASLVLIVLCFMGPLGYWHAAVLLGLLGVVLVDMVRSDGDGRIEAVDEIGAVTAHAPLWRPLGLVAIGLVGLPIGADLLIDGAIGIATRLGLSDAVIGLTLVAVGTSLPELATTVSAAFRDRADLAFGNVVGSNVFNILGILGITSLFGPVPIGPEFLTRDLWVMLAAALLLVPVVFLGWRITRAGGVLLLLAYGGYTYSLFL
jgi:cation:H+ antiporter